MESLSDTLLMVFLKLLIIFFTLSCAFQGGAFEGFETAVQAAKNLFLSSMEEGQPPIQQIKDYKQSLIEFTESPVFQNLNDDQKKKIHSLIRYSKRYLDISNYLDECEKRLEHPDKRNLIGQMRKGLSLDGPLCGDLAVELFSTAQRQSIEDILEPAEEAAFTEDLKFNSIKNAGLAILKYKLQLGLSDHLKPSELNKLAHELCGRWCGRERKESLKEFLTQSEQKIRQDIENGVLTKYSAQSGAQELNKRITNLENTLERIDFEMRTITENKESMNQIYDLYFEQYTASTGSILGVLLLTKVIRKESGSLINLTDIESQVFKEKTLQNGQTIYEGSRPRHLPLADSYSCRKKGKSKPQIVSAEEAGGLTNCVLSQAAEDKFTLAVEEAVKRAKKFSKKIRKNNNLKKLIKKSPVAAGQSLMKYPGAAVKVCDAVISIVKNQQRNNQISNHADTAVSYLKDGAVGVVAAGVEPASRYASKAVKTAGSYFLSASVLGGVGLGVVKAAMGAGKSAVFIRQKQEIINSRIALATTNSDVERIRNIENELTLSRARLMDAGMGMVPFGALNKIRKVRGWARMRGQASTLKNQLESEEYLVQLHKELLEPQNQEIRDNLSELSKDSKAHAQRAGILMIGLSQMEPEIKTQVLNRLNSTENLRHDSIQVLVDDLEEIMNQCAV